MRNKYNQKSTKSFIFPLIVLESIIVGIVLINLYFGENLSLLIYQNTLKTVTFTFGIIAALFGASGLAAIYVYKKNTTSIITKVPTKITLRIILPTIMYLSEIFKLDKTGVQDFYIILNNIYIHSQVKKVLPEQIVIILPHCLQNSSCNFKVTNDISKCVMCGRCCIGQIREIAEEYNVKVFVATGGTVARSIIAKYKPSVVIPVACERDLASGISDMRKVPAIGILNSKPNGPCRDTHVNVEILRQELNQILGENK